MTGSPSSSRRFPGARSNANPGSIVMYVGIIVWHIRRKMAGGGAPVRWIDEYQLPAGALDSGAQRSAGRRCESCPRLSREPERFHASPRSTFSPGGPEILSILFQSRSPSSPAGCRACGGRRPAVAVTRRSRAVRNARQLDGARSEQQAHDVPARSVPRPRPFAVDLSALLARRILGVPRWTMSPFSSWYPSGTARCLHCRLSSKLAPNRAMAQVRMVASRSSAGA